MIVSAPDTPSVCPRAVVQFSTGAGSAEVAYRAVERHGARNVTLMTADTLIEDEDNWRFATEVHAQLGCEWLRVADGRTPMQLAKAQRFIPNDRAAHCSRILKRELLRRYLDALFDPADTIVYLGFDWTEERRLWDACAAITCGKCKRQKREPGDPYPLTPCPDHILGRCEQCDTYLPPGAVITAEHVHPWSPWRLAAPLMDPPYLTKPQILDAMRARGIEPPRLYAEGFSHANCGGGCVRAGQAAWAHLLQVRPDEYARWEAEENEVRVHIGKDVSILTDRRGGSRRPLTLAAFREREQADDYDHDDWGSCGCTEDAVQGDLFNQEAS